MNALEMLQAYLQRASAGGGAFDGAADRSDSLPPRDVVERAPGQSYQGYIGEQLHPNELGIYAAPKPPPAGDVVLPPSTAYAAPYMPRVGSSENQRLWEQQVNTNFVPGPYGRTQISAGQGLLQSQEMPSPEMLAALAARQRNWEAQQDSPAYDEGEIMAPEPWWNEALGGQLEMSGPQRDEALPADLADTRDKENWPVLREGEYASRRPQGVSPFASPLNQFLQLGRRAPLSLY